MRRHWVFFGSVVGLCAIVLSVIIGQSRMMAQQDGATEAFIVATMRQESKNNLKQILLALHNYHAQYNHFPPGTHPSPNLKPAQRLSWEAAILPFLEQQAVYSRLVLDKPWDDRANRAAIGTTVKTLLNPGLEPPKDKDLPPTHYVGLAGLGADGPTLPVDSPRAGCFAYDRPTQLKDIKDGTSNTMMVSEASKDYGSWAAGGRPTLRSLTKEPVMNGPDGIGGPWQEGMLAAFADGSVRFVSKHVDPTLFKALMTINGHEKVDLGRR